MQQVALASRLLAKGENMSAYPHLLQPLDFGFYHIKEPYWLMGSMHIGLEEAPQGYERMAAFYGTCQRWCKSDCNWRCFSK